MKDALLYIDGQYAESANRRWHVVVDPATGKDIGRSALATKADVDRAVIAASRVAQEWADIHADERADIIHRAADFMQQRIDEIVSALTLEQGKPLADSRKEIEFGIQVLQYYAEEGRRVSGQLRPAASTDIKNVVSFHPVGIVGAIVPWNYPVDLYCWKVGPALAAGCPIIVKPPPETPFAIEMAMKCFVDAGIPDGVIANLPGTGAEAGQALSEHLGIACVSATASVAAGQDIMRRASTSLKRLSLELGGHAPFVVLPDANIELAANAAMRRSFSNMGQICISVNRILVHESIHDVFVDALCESSRNIELGHGTDPNTAYGPVLNQSVIDRTVRHVDDALEKGGQLLLGGKQPSASNLADGYFFEPTIIDNAPLDSLPMIDESYGPLAAVHSCATLTEMETISNSLPYGLTAYVYSDDLEAAWSLAERLQFGAVGVNVNDTSELQAPFGGWKLSGVGRELGVEGLHTFLEKKHIKLRVRRDQFVQHSHLSKRPH